jgi:uncharacterized membrane protein YraQ (UPF0718 family)
MVASRNFLASLLLHAGLAVIIGFWTPMMNKSRLTDQNLPIEIITIDQFTKLVEQTTMPDKPAEKAASQPTAHEHSGAPEAANQSAMPLLRRQLRRRAIAWPSLRHWRAPQLNPNRFWILVGCRLC